MPYEILSHTADLRIKLTADSLENLFKEALRAMAEILGKNPKSKTPVARKISVISQDKTALLVDFLNEILALSQINKEVYTKIDFPKFSETNLEAVLEGQKIKKFDEDIKAATHHEADIRQNKDGRWETILVFDI